MYQQSRATLDLSFYLKNLCVLPRNARYHRWIQQHLFLQLVRSPVGSRANTKTDLAVLGMLCTESKRDADAMDT